MGSFVDRQRTDFLKASHSLENIILYGDNGDLWTRNQSQLFTSSIGPLVSHDHAHIVPPADTYDFQASIKALHLVSMNEAPPVPLEDRLAKDLSPTELRELLNRAQQVCMRRKSLALILTYI